MFPCTDGDGVENWKSSFDESKKVRMEAFLKDTGYVEAQKELGNTFE